MAAARLLWLQAVALLAYSLLAVGSLASDPELVTDFQVPDGKNLSDIDGEFFTFKGFRGGVRAAGGTFGIKKAFAQQFPALSGLGISSAILEYRPKTVNPPHTHPRGSELLYVIQGILHVGVVDTSGELYTQKLMPGDLFVFPKGLVHFQMNFNGHKTVRAIAFLSSSNPGLVSLPSTLFDSSIDAAVLKQAFKIDDQTLLALELPFVFSHILEGGH